MCLHQGFSKSIKLKIKYRAYHHSKPGRLYLCICVFVFVISSSKAREAGPVMCEGIQRSPQLKIESRKEEGDSKTNWQASTRQGAKNQTQKRNWKFRYSARSEARMCLHWKCQFLSFEEGYHYDLRIATVPKPPIFNLWKKTNILKV